MKTKAQEELTQLKEELNMGESGPKFELILGDITKPNLNIETETNKQLIDSVRYVSTWQPFMTLLYLKS